MIVEADTVVGRLVAAVLGERLAQDVLQVLEPMVPGEAADARVSRADFAAALNVLLFADLLERVPGARLYVEDVKGEGRKVCFDHGAIRTIRFAEGDTGALPAGELAFRRILEPLGYEDAALYPLPALRMTGRAYRHRDFPETIPQFFVSELHVDQFDAAFGDTCARVFGASREPLDAGAKAALARFAAGETLTLDEAAKALPSVVAAFDRQHDEPQLADYEHLKEVSKEAAWIATEGNAFNHATDRVADVDALAEVQRALGRAMKDKVEVSKNGRVRQTAYRADMVERRFRRGDDVEALIVPGSFYEFISRAVDPETGRLDLSFDSGNATGIFHMTKSA